MGQVHSIVRPISEHMPEPSYATIFRPFFRGRETEFDIICDDAAPILHLANWLRKRQPLFFNNPTVITLIEVMYLGYGRKISLPHNRAVDTEIVSFEEAISILVHSDFAQRTTEGWKHGDLPANVSTMLLLTLKEISGNIISPRDVSALTELMQANPDLFTIYGDLVIFVCSLVKRYDAERAADPDWNQ